MQDGPSDADRYRRWMINLPNPVFRVMDGVRCRHFCKDTHLPVKLRCRTALRNKKGNVWEVSGTIEPDGLKTHYALEVVSISDSTAYDLETSADPDNLSFKVDIRVITGKKLKLFLTTREYSPYLNRRSYIGTIRPNASVNGYCIDIGEGSSEVYDGGNVCVLRSNPTLYVTHNWGGGAKSFLDGRIVSDISEGTVPMVLTCMSGSYVVRTYSENKCDTRIMDGEELLERYLMLSSPGTVALNELTSFDNPNKILSLLERISEQARLVMFVHDYHCIHPSFLLMHDGKTFDPTSDNGGMDSEELKEWRGFWKRFLDSCDEVVVFSESSKKILESVYGDMDNIVLRPHSVNGIRAVNPHEPGSCLNIAMIGDLMPQKGSAVISEMCRTIREKKLNIRVFHYGTTYLPPIDGLIEHGRYDREELPGLMESDCIDTVIIPSVWPETFSFTTEEAMMMGLPVAVFDLGAPAERVRSYGKGIIVPETTAASALESVMRFNGRP